MGLKDAAAKRLYYKKWNAANADKIKAAYAKYKAKYPERVRARHRKHRYGLTMEQFEKMQVEQKGLCAICKRKPEDTSRGILVVDHDHATKKVRALLCNNCNVAVAHVKESIDTAMELVSHLFRHKQVRV